MAKNTAKRLVLDPRHCKGCGICVEFCPQGVLRLVGQKCRIAEPEKCTKCGLCELRCPDYAIWLEAETPDGASSRETADWDGLNTGATAFGEVAHNA